MARFTSHASLKLRCTAGGTPGEYLAWCCGDDAQVVARRARFNRCGQDAASAYCDCSDACAMMHMGNRSERCTSNRFCDWPIGARLKSVSNFLLGSLAGAQTILQATQPCKQSM
jgi:hypothetical protein